MSVANIFPNKEQLDTANVLLAAIAGQSGGIAMKSFKDLQMLNRLGLASKVLVPGDQITVEKESSVSATVSGDITAASVTEDTFIAKIGEVHGGVYEFIYDGAAWHLNGEAVELSEYGITPTGTPAADDMIAVHVTASTLVFDIVGIDQQTPADPNLTHSITLLLHDAYSSMAYMPQEAIACVRSGGPLPAGDYYFEISDSYGGAENSGYTYVGFTLTQAVPTGGQICLNWTYQKQLSTCKISTYNKYATSAIESNVAISDTNTGTKLGNIANSTIATTDVSGVTVAVNNASRMRYGSNDVRNNKIMKWLSSAAASGWDVQTGEFERPLGSPTAGFLHGMDPEFVSVLGKVKLRTALNTVTDSGFVDGEYLGWLPSMTELGFGANNSVNEVSPNASGNYTNTPFALYSGAVNADRIKYNSATARYWWLRSPDPSRANSERLVITDGSLSNVHAYSGYWTVPGLTII